MEYVFSETACMMMDFIPNVFTGFWDHEEHFVQLQTSKQLSRETVALKVSENPRENYKIDKC